MTRVHPQAAKVPFAVIGHGRATNVRIVSSAEEARQLYGWHPTPDVFLRGFVPNPCPKYGRGVPPGEAFRLTAGQLRQWRKR